MNPRELVLKRGAGQRVEGAERLVHEEHGGLDREGPRQSDSLAHAARKLRGLLVVRGREAHHGEVPLDVLALLLLL